MSSSAFSASASACTSASAFAANTSYGACADVDPAPLTLDVLDAMEAGVTSTTTFGAIEAGQGRIVLARAGNSNSEQCSKYYTQAFAFDDDDDADAAEEYDAEDAEDDARTGPLGKRPKGTAAGLKGGEEQVVKVVDILFFNPVMIPFWFIVAMFLAHFAVRAFSNPLEQSKKSLANCSPSSTSNA